MGLNLRNHIIVSGFNHIVKMSVFFFNVRAIFMYHFFLTNNHNLLFALNDSLYISLKKIGEIN